MTVRHLHPEPMPPMSERAACMLPGVEELAKRIRSGEFRSIAWVAISDDGTESPTYWNLAPGDSLKVLHSILQTDIITSRSDS